MHREQDPPQSGHEGWTPLELPREQEHERQGELSRDNHQREGTPTPGGTRDIPRRIQGHVADPDDEELREGDVCPEDGEGQEKLA